MAYCPPAAAQFLFGWGSRGDYLTPREVSDIVEDYGYTPVTRPRLTGDLYVVEGRDPRGYRVRLLVDAYSGNVVRRALLTTPSDRRLDVEAMRPPGSVPQADEPLTDQRPVETSPKPQLPAKKPAETRSKAKHPVTAARPPSEAKPPAPHQPSPAEAAKPATTAARPPGATEPSPVPVAPPPIEEAKPATTAVVPSGPARGPARAIAPAPGASTVPPVLLDDVRPKALPEPPPMVPPVTLE
jgi:hypothetical protein